MDGDSYIDFGTPNTAVMDGSVTYINIESSNAWWSAQLEGFRWTANMEDTAEYAIKTGDYALTDTGTSCIIGPADEVDVIRNSILETMDIVYADTNWSYVFACPADYSTMPAFDFLFGGYWLNVLAEDYIIDVSTDGSWCSLCLSSADGFDEWILGDAFMRGWYNIHDHANTRIGFVPFTGSGKAAPEAVGTTPTETIPGVTLTNIGSLLFGIPASTFWILFTLFFTLTCCVACCAVYFVSVLSSKTQMLARGKKMVSSSENKREKED